MSVTYTTDDATTNNTAVANVWMIDLSKTRRISLTPFQRRRSSTTIGPTGSVSEKRPSFSKALEARNEGQEENDGQNGGDDQEEEFEDGYLVGLDNLIELFKEIAGVQE